MRDPKRIDKIINKLRDLWKTYPDLRLGQLIRNLTPEDRSTFYMEDEELLMQIEDYHLPCVKLPVEKEGENRVDTNRPTREYIKEAIEKIDSLFEDAADRAIYLIKKEARRILQEDDGLDEFIMAMGSAFFTMKKGGKYDYIDKTDEEYKIWYESDEYVRFYNGILDDENYEKEFFDVIEELDEKFHVRGYPVRFKANTQEVRDWGDPRIYPIKYIPLEDA